MPILKENRSRYPAKWGEIRQDILRRAKYCCEWCGVPIYAVGYRDENGRFVAAYGSAPIDAIGRGKTWPNESIRTTYAEAKEHAFDFNFNDGEHHWIVIVLTIAHVHDHAPENCDSSNLAALCQRCHIRHDAPIKAKRRRDKRRENQPTLFQLD